MPHGPLRFEDFPAASYSGPRHAPDYSGKSRHYRTFRTLIRNGFAGNELFAGRYALFGAGCGTDCVSYILGDLKTGHLTDFPLGGETNADLTLQYRPNSRLVKAQWNVAEDNGSDSCQSEDLVWNGASFKSGPPRSAPGRCPN